MNHLYRIVVSLAVVATALSFALPASASASATPIAGPTAATSQPPVTAASIGRAGTIAKRIQFRPGASSARLYGRLGTNGMDTYVLRALAGQTLTVRVSSPQAQMLFSISGANGEVLKSSGAGSSVWSGQLPVTQDYIIAIHTAGGAAARYTLDVAVPPPGRQPARIRFQPGGTSATRGGTLGANAIDVYVLEARAGQTMKVDAWSSGRTLLLSVWGADGNVLKSSGAGSAHWSGRLPTSQDYYIAISSADGSPAAYALQVTIPPLRR